MRRFNERETDVLNRILSVGSDKTISISEFLEEFFFTDKDGRALIIQAQGRYAVFFLQTSVFDDQDKRKYELEVFFELIALINYLRNHGYISIYKGEKTKEKTMFFLHDLFTNPLPTTGNILLNARGDYTSTPDTIHNKNKEVIYKGVVFESDTYEMIINTVIGTLVVSQHLKDMFSKKIVDEKPLRTNGNKQNSIPIWVVMILIMLLVVLAGYIYLDRKAYEDLQTLVSNNHNNMQKRLDEVSQAICMLDSIVSSTKVKPVHSVDTATHSYGIDISKWNGDLIKEIDVIDSLSFVICKATEGVSLIDAKFNSNWALIKSKGLTRGAYHLYRTGDNPITQAHFFWSQIATMGTCDISPIVDVEELSITHNTLVDKDTLQANLLVFLAEIKRLSGCTPIIYTDLSFANTYLTNMQFASYPLWLAYYSNKPDPELPKTWRSKGLKIWQRSNKYNLDSHTVDFDVCRGNILYRES